MTEIDPNSIKSIKDLFMATYVFECEDCAGVFEITARMGEAPSRPTCVKCNSSKTGRNFALENKMFIPPASTLGSLADKNATKLSEDHKAHIAKKNKENA